MGGDTRNWLASNPSGTFVAQGGSATNCGIAVKPAAVLVNLTVAGTQSGPAFLTAWPFNQAKPLAASLNWVAAGTQVANAIILPLCTGGGCTSDWSLFASSGTELIVDVMGYFAAPTGGFVTGSCPDRGRRYEASTRTARWCASRRRQRDVPAADEPWILDFAGLGTAAATPAASRTVRTPMVLHLLRRRNCPGAFRVDIESSPRRGRGGRPHHGRSDPRGFPGASPTARYGYLFPTSKPAASTGGSRVSTCQNFTLAGVTFLDLTTVDPALEGFHGDSRTVDTGTSSRSGSVTARHGKLVRVDLANQSGG